MYFRKITILLVGLDNAGKTSIIKSIMKGKSYTNTSKTHEFYDLLVNNNKIKRSNNYCLRTYYVVNLNFHIFSFRKTKKHSSDCWVFVFQIQLPRQYYNYL